MRRFLAAFMILAAVLTVGCGGGDSAAEPLTEDERLVVLTFRASAASTGAALDGLGDLDADKFWEDAEAMVALARSKPDADSGVDGRTVREVLIEATGEFDLGPEVGARITDALTGARQDL